MQFFEDLIENTDLDRVTVLTMLAAPLVHVAVCDGVDFEEREWLHPFCESLEISFDLLGSQITDDEYRLAKVLALKAWVDGLAPAEAEAVLTTLKMICNDVAVASADRDGNHISPDEHIAIREVGEILGW